MQCNRCSVRRRIRKELHVSITAIIERKTYWTSSMVHLQVELTSPFFANVPNYTIFHGHPFWRFQRAQCRRLSNLPFTLIRPVCSCRSGCDGSANVGEGDGKGRFGFEGGVNRFCHEPWQSSRREVDAPANQSKATSHTTMIPRRLCVMSNPGLSSSELFSSSSDPSIKLSTACSASRFILGNT